VYELPATVAGAGGAIVNNANVRISFGLKGATGTPGSGSNIVMREVDNAPNATVSEIVVPNGSLSIAGSVATLLFSSTGRALATSLITYFVRTDGNDSNTGLTNNAAGAFLTIDRAQTALKSIDHNGFTPVIQIGDGTFAETPVLGALVGTESAVLRGNGNTTILSSNTSHPSALGGVVSCYQNGTKWSVENMRLQLTNSALNRSLLFLLNGFMEYSGIDFGQGSANYGQIWVVEGGIVLATGDYSISAGGRSHFYGNNTGIIRAQGRTITITNTPAFSTAFALADFGGKIVSTGCTFTGTATGSRYRAETASQIITVGGANYFPGNSAGFVDSAGFGAYI
jgi:hypothetical protein